MNKKDSEELKKFQEALARHSKKVCRTKESARQYLIALGIHNEDGTIHKNYGGDDLPSFPN